MITKGSRLTQGVFAAGLLVGIGFTGRPAPVSARPEAPSVVCGVYPDAPACAAGQVGCDFCHTVPPARHLYGDQLLSALRELTEPPPPGQPIEAEAFLEKLPEALTSIEGLDTDEDGYSNLEEINFGSLPQSADSTPKDAACTPDDSLSFIDPNPSNGWDVCGYDFRYVFKKIHLDVCGRSPTRQEVADFMATEDQMVALDAALDVCLDTEYWLGKNGVLWNLANDKIRPIQALKSGTDEGPIPLADYDDDYAFFVYTQIDDHDAREVLTGQLFVERKGGESTTYETWDRPLLDDVNQRGFFRAQAVTRSRRAGLVTHRWFLMTNTMFTGLPRTTAAQAYRGYLGLDISKLEGLSPIEGEPVDYDAKGVAEPECARCHSTLDPLTYPFSRYEGIGGGEGDLLDGGRRLPFSYNRVRMRYFAEVDGPKVVDTPEAGYIFGQQVDNLVAWGRVAADSDQFAQATVKDYWTLLMGDPPQAVDLPEFTTLWRDFRGTHEYRVERMLHALIRTEAYGVP